MYLLLLLFLILEFNLEVLESQGRFLRKGVIALEQPDLDRQQVSNLLSKGMEARRKKTRKR